MVHRKPHEIVNRLFEARNDLRSHIPLETALIERISTLPEDDYCCTDIESLQLGAGYAHLLHEGQNIFEPAQYEAKYTMFVLQAFFATRPINRYRHEHMVYEQQKQICEAVLTPDIGLSDHLDPYEVSAAAMFLEGYLMTTAYHESRSPDVAMYG